MTGLDWAALSACWADPASWSAVQDMAAMAEGAVLAAFAAKRAEKPAAPDARPFAVAGADPATLDPARYRDV